MTSGVLGWMNTGLAVLGTFAAFGAVNKMEWGKTKPCVMGAVILIAVGLVGQWLGLLRDEWAQYADTALYGGILALILSTQRVHTWCLERWSNPFASAIVLTVGVVFLLGLLGGCSQARAQELDKPMLVVAAESQDGGPWRRTVMLALPFSNGHIGLILNRPTSTKMGRVFPENAGAQNVVEPVYLGGPEHQQRMMVLFKGDKPGPKSLAVTDGIWLVGAANEIDAILEKTPNAARYYVGYVTWDEGELRDEIRRGWMIARPLDASKLFAPDPSKLYDEVVTPNRRSPLSI